MKNCKEKGITLIALVITIIVLLILAGVSIATLIGENGILTKTQDAKIQNTKSQAEEEVKLAVGTLQIEESTKEMTQEEKRQLLENELKKQQTDSTVTIDRTGFLANHRGYEFEIDSKYNVEEPFNAEVWDDTASDEDCFLWGSDIEGEVGYNSVVGYTEKIENYTILKFPSRCQEIVCDGTYDEVITNEGKGRAFTQNIVKVELPETVTNIGTLAFAGHEYPYTTFQSLESIKIPNSVISIGDRAFYKCNGLTEITIPGNVTSIGDRAFSYSKSLKSVTILEGVTSIGNSAFEGCAELANITIPDSVTNIESYAFGTVSWGQISDTAVYYVVPGSYADTWVQAHKYGNQTINYITE